MKPTEYIERINELTEELTFKSPEMLILIKDELEEITTLMEKTLEELEDKLQ